MSEEAKNFLYLPTDVIWKIFERLEHQDVLRAAAVCHELAAVASYTYYVAAGPGFSNPQRKCSISLGEAGGSGAKLNALSLDFQLTTIEQLIVNVHQTNNIVRLQTLTRDVYRLGNVVSRLSSVGCVCISFPSMGSTMGLSSKPVQEFAVVFLRLLDIIMQKSCRSFHIQNFAEVFTEPNFRFELVKEDKPPFLRSLVSQVNTPSPSDGIQGKGWKYSKMNDIPLSDLKLRGKGWKYTKIYDSLIPLLHSPILSQRRLTHVDLKCDFLLVPPFSPWTFGILKSSPVTSLTLSFPQRVGPHELRNYIFPNLVKSLPLLQEFNFEFRAGGDALSVVVENLPSFPHLEKITMGNAYYGPFPNVRPEHDVGGKSMVSTITGSLDQILHLLARLCFPNLKSINVLIEFRYRLETHFVEIASRFHLLNDLVATKCGPKSSPRISVRLLDQGDALFANTPYPLQALLAADNRITWITHFRHVISLYLDLTVYPDVTAYPNAARRWDPRNEQKYATEYALTWLGIFCGVESLTLLCRHPFLDSSDSERKDRITTMSADISEVYPNVQSFDIVLMGEHTLRHWACDGDEWGRGVAISEELAECHFNPMAYTRSLKPDWVMHGDGDS